ncbi:hypothetical protein [Pseudoduganella armeniaca]|nr:hypothetical protein [Pseudoduganella armeniaca]
MLKFCFAVLLLANAALFAYGQGFLGSFQGKSMSRRGCTSS